MQQAVLREQFDYSTGSHTRGKALWQGLSRSTRRRKGAKRSHTHCIKDGVFLDPPYNTGEDFIYRDNFSQSRGEYGEEAGSYDGDGDRLFKNTEAITYDKLTSTFGTEVFTEPNLKKGQLGVSAMQASRHLYDYVIYDSTNERDFTLELESHSGEVEVYVKLGLLYQYLCGKVQSRLGDCFLRGIW